MIKVKFTIVLVWNQPDSTNIMLTGQTYQDVINFVVALYATAEQERIKSLIIQPDHLVSYDEHSNKKEYFTAAQLKAA